MYFLNNHSKQRIKHAPLNQDVSLAWAVWFIVTSHTPEAVIVALV